VERTVLVTGAGRGIGLATALQAAVAGLRVVGLVPTDRQAGALRAAAAERGVTVDVVKADLGDPDARRGLAADLGLWGLVNNAGYMNAGQLRDVPLDDARRQLEVMALAPLDLALQALPAMTARGHGRIVNVASAAVHSSTPLTGWYSASKAALRELTDALRVELRDTGVAVVDIEPGGIKTDIWTRADGELTRRAERSSRPDVYRQAKRRLEKLQPHAVDPERVGTAITEVLLSGDPPRHRRVGVDAAPLRLLNELLPEAWWDRTVSSLVGQH